MICQKRKTLPYKVCFINAMLRGHTELEFSVYLLKLVSPGVFYME